MQNLRNSVRLIGNVRNSPEVKEISKDKKLAKFSIATTDTYKNVDGEKVSDTQWHNMVAWGNVAKVVEMYLKRGSEVTVEGKLTSRNYTDKEGIKRYITEFVVSEIVLIGNKKD